MTTLADKVTLARLVIAPLAVAGYLFLPVEYGLAFYVCAALGRREWLRSRSHYCGGTTLTFGSSSRSLSIGSVHFP